jgi:ABC-2 type transport system permease protein
MKQTLTIAKRELAVFFCSPIAYVVMAIFAALTSLLYVLVFLSPGEAASMAGLFSPVVFVLLILLVPAVSMRLVSEEFGRGTIETLMTAPVSDTQVVLGKYLGALGFLAALLAWLAAPIAVLCCFARPELGPVVTGLLGLLLVGGLYLAIGLFASSVTGNQVIAFILALFLIGPLVLVDILGFIIARLPVAEGLRRAIYYLSVYNQLDGFNKGVFTIANLVYFVSIIGLFLFLTVKVVESRRWR